MSANLFPVLFYTHCKMKFVLLFSCIIASFASSAAGYTNQQVAVQKPTNQEADDDIKLKYPAIPVAIGRFMVDCSSHCLMSSVTRDYMTPCIYQRFPFICQFCRYTYKCGIRRSYMH
ncbi:unnamed protein product [Clavelina lepadiformis]|uniref:Secreted protein n=1 Tax=Clavelina lepadiformis TaxID=159417 RepID=A0ABP0EWH6_CLALP